MTVTSPYVPPQYVGNGIATIFPFSNSFFDPAELIVDLFNTSTGAAVSPAAVLNGAATYDYTVTGVQDPNTGEYLAGCSITFNTAPPATFRITIYRSVIAQQNVALGNNTSFPAKTVEGALDRAMMIIGQLLDGASRDLRVPISDVAPNMQYPVAPSRSNRIAAFDGAGSAAVSSFSLSSLESLLASWTVNPLNSTAYIPPFLNSVARTIGGKLAECYLSVTDFGAIGNGIFDCTVAIQRAVAAAVVLGGAIVWFPTGTYVVSDKITGATNVYLEGRMGTVIVNQITNNKSIFDFSDKSRCGAKGFSLNGGPASVFTPVINVVAATADVNELALEDIYIESMGVNGCGYDMQSTASKIVYFPLIRNVNVKGGSAADWQNKISARFGTVGQQPVVRPQCYGGRMWRTDYGVVFNNIAGCDWYGLRMDDINGTNGIGISCGTASDVHMYGVQMEAGTFKKYASLGALTSYCRFEIPAIEPTPTQWVDAGTKNSLKGQTGSGGVPNYEGQAQDFNSQVRIQSSADFVQYKDNWSNIQAPAAGVVAAGGNTGPIAILGPRTNKTVMFEFSFYGRESTTNASWFLKGWGLACWGGANTILTYGIEETTERGSTGMNAFGAYAIGTVVASTSGNAVRIQLNNTGANNLNGVRYSVRSTEADT